MIRPILILLAITVALLSFGSSPARRAAGSEVSTALTVAEAPPVEQVLNEYGHPTGSNYLSALAEEREVRDNLPVSAAQLTALLLWVFFGAAVWRSGRSAWKRFRSRVPSLAQSWFFNIICFVQRRPAATLSEVFRL